jgi:ribosomal protein S18 acetylase RimI-like enzyme
MTPGSSAAAAVTGHPLDNPLWAALTGPQASFAQVHGRAARYLPDVSPFASLEGRPDEAAWADLARLAGPGAEVLLAGVPEAPPGGWTVLGRERGVQMVDIALAAVPDPEAQVLGPSDVPDMLDLVARTEPGPIRSRTIELGRYLGIRRNGALVALAGERLHLSGWTEISAVCTDEAYRGQGLASRLVRAVAAGIRSRGETPFLHTLARNTTAIHLYEHLGFALRREMEFAAVRVPQAGSPVQARL